MTKLIECVPNFSEGRRQDVIDKIADAIATVADVNLLHVTSDYDHNRTVMTFAGSPEGVMRASYNAIKIASELIDMTQHSGVHPRIGATDVVPFIPLEGATMDDCIEISRELGQKVADNLDLPVYLYEYASIRPERKSLAIIRRGQYEDLVNTITEPDRQPDYGKPIMGSAGAVTIGARKALIAYNVYLTTDDVTIAQKIARSIRGSSGGLRGVKALGLLVKGRAQVSMNLVDYQNTPIYRVMELIRLEASKLGVQIYESELIGLMPQDALLQSARWYLQLPHLSDSDILENQLNSNQK